MSLFSFFTDHTVKTLLFTSNNLLVQFIT